MKYALQVCVAAIAVLQCSLIILTGPGAAAWRMGSENKNKANQRHSCFRVSELLLKPSTAEMIKNHLTTIAWPRSDRWTAISTSRAMWLVSR